MQKLLDYLNLNKQRQMDELKKLLEIPSISAQSEHNKDTRAAAEWIKNHLVSIGMENASVMETDGHPVVYADWLNASGKPTILIYGHYDVQAPDPVEDWITPPFQPSERDGNLYARGTADDKGQLFTHIKAVEALLATYEHLPVNIKFLIEGEEEVGGIHLDEFIENNKDLLKADVCVISDSHSLSTTQPFIDYGLRGLTYMQIELQSMPKDVHSGIYGGNVPNVAIEMANIIAKLKDTETQKVLIPNFYDNVRKITSDEDNELRASMFNEESVLEESGAKRILGVAHLSPAERAGAKPTLDVNGMISGYTGQGPKTIIPAKATAKISMRLVPNQSSKVIEAKFTEFVKSITPEYLDLKIECLSTGEPILFDRGSIYFKNAENAFEVVFGNKPMYELSGGSIPVTATFKQLLCIDSVLMGFGLPDDGLHSPNEKISIEMFYKGIETSARFLSSFE